jgi:uncharacterized protein
LNRIDFQPGVPTILPQLSTIRINVGGVDLTGTLDSSPLTEKLLRLMPFETTGESWGREVYFPVRLEMESGPAVSEVRVGDIAYWPEGPDVCVFFGPTPKSTGDAPVVAHPVTVIGRFEFGPDDFDRIERRRNGIAVRVEKGQ